MLHIWDEWKTEVDFKQAAKVGPQTEYCWLTWLLLKKPFQAWIYLSPLEIISDDGVMFSEWHQFVRENPIERKKGDWGYVFDTSKLRVLEIAWYPDIRDQCREKWLIDEEWIYFDYESFVTQYDALRVHRWAAWWWDVDTLWVNSMENTKMLDSFSLTPCDETVKRVEALLSKSR